MAKITFYGGVGSVTGSKYLLESNGKKILVDCGLFQGEKELRERNWSDPPFKPSQLDAVIITHAHIDHTGFLPRLVKLGFAGKVWTSRATADLMKILLLDSARLQSEEADYRNRHNLTSHSPALPLYDEEDAKETFKLLNPVPNTGEPHEICEGITASFRVAGHIIGASEVLVEMANARENGDSIKFLFSGDLGHYDQPIINDPAPPPSCDYLMCESTYGNRLHGDVTSDVRFAEIINEAFKRDAPILIPAFAVGRTQEILYMLRELEDEGKIPSMPVVVDSPMAAQATQIYNRFSEEHDEEYASILREKDSSAASRLDADGKFARRFQKNQRYERRTNYHFGFGNADRRARSPSRNANSAERKCNDNFRRLPSVGNDRTQNPKRRQGSQNFQELDSSQMPRRARRRFFRPRRLENRPALAFTLARNAAAHGFHHSRRTRSGAGNGAAHPRRIRLARRSPAI